MNNIVYSKSYKQKKLLEIVQRREMKDNTFYKVTNKDIYVEIRNMRQELQSIITEQERIKQRLENQERFGTASIITLLVVVAAEILRWVIK